MSAYGSKQSIKEFDRLSSILQDVNKRYGTDFTDEDKVILGDLTKRLVDDKSLEGSMKHNTRETAKVKFDEAFQRELIKLYSDHFNFYKKVNGSNESKNHIMEKLFMSIYSQQSSTEATSGAEFTNG